MSRAWAVAGPAKKITAKIDIQRDEQAIEAAVAHGISIFKSTGDDGAYQCQKFKTADHRLSVEWPASSPGVVAVGGTSLSVSPVRAARARTARRTSSSIVSVVPAFGTYASSQEKAQAASPRT